jgi:hypothetical protein
MHAPLHDESATWYTVTAWNTRAKLDSANSGQAVAWIPPCQLEAEHLELYAQDGLGAPAVLFKQHITGTVPLYTHPASSAPQEEQDCWRALSKISMALGNPCLEATGDQTLEDALADYIIAKLRTTKLPPIDSSLVVGPQEADARDVLARFGALVFDAFMSEGGDMGDIDAFDLQEIGSKSGMLTEHVMGMSLPFGSLA